MSKCKKIKYRKCGRKRRKKSCKRNYVTRTTCSKGGCIPSTQDALTSTTFPGCGTTRVGAPACGGGATYVRDPTHGCGACDPSSFSFLSSGAYPGSSETHLHVDRCGHVYGHTHLGGDQPHYHDSGCQDYYVGRVSDLRSLTRDPDLLNVDVLGSSCTKGCGSHGDCAADEFCGGGQCIKAGYCGGGEPRAKGYSCQGGYCLPNGDSGVRNTTRPSNIGCSTLSRGSCDPGRGLGCARSTLSSGCSTSLSACGNIGGRRPCNGYSVGGFRDPAGCNSVNCSSCRFTSASLCDGSTTSHCNLACAAPGNGSTLPPEYFNTYQKTVDLRGSNNDGFSVITSSLSGSKRPTVCKSKIKEVYYC